MEEENLTRDVEWFEVQDETMKNFLITMFKENVQRNYYVSGVVLVDGKWAIRLKRRLKIGQCRH